MKFSGNMTLLTKIFTVMASYRNGLISHLTRACSVSSSVSTKSASPGRRQETATSRTDKYFRKRLTDSSTSTWHPRQRRRINISKQQYSCQVPICPGSAGLCRLPCTVQKGATSPRAYTRISLCPVHVCAHLHRFLFRMWPVESNASSEYQGVAYSLNYSYIVRLKGKSTDGSECWRCIV